MRTRVAATAFLLALLTLVGASPARAAKPPTTTAVPPPPPPPSAWILVDADTGTVLSAQQARVPKPPASTIKLLTALIATQHLEGGDPIPISATAAGMPARKINVKTDQVWTYDSLIHSMLMVSANDAAVAIAEKLGGGSLDGFAKVAHDTADRLGLADQPVLNDPAGLDNEFANKGGSSISPRDLAIVARAVLHQPELLAIIQTERFKFQGGDGIGHVLTNHDLFLSLYPGATGLKTGTTDKAGRTFVGTATRDGRTMLAVVFDAVDVYASTGKLLDQGFATPVSAESALSDRLPDVVGDASRPTTTLPPTDGQAAGTNTPLASSGSGLSLDSAPAAVAILVVGLVPLVFIRRRLGAVRD
jgi:D-alanyl-D-alanine carboxypeptidase (penicillin-binding protein 5/6)